MLIIAKHSYLHLTWNGSKTRLLLAHELALLSCSRGVHSRTPHNKELQSSISAQAVPLENLLKSSLNVPRHFCDTKLPMVLCLWPSHIVLLRLLEIEQHIFRGGNTRRLHSYNVLELVKLFQACNACTCK